MTEKIIDLESVELIHLYGVNDIRFKRLVHSFPKVKIIGRGHEIKVIGEDEEILAVEEKILKLLAHINKYNVLTDEQFENISGVNSLTDSGLIQDDDVIVYGNTGKPIRAMTEHQKQVVNEYNDNDLMIAVGPAGTGKTYMAIALAVRALRNKEVRRIILSRPAVEAEERIGFLPGDMKEKLDPYLQPLYDALNDMVPPRRLAEYMRDGIIQIAPLGFMRGRTLSNSFVVLDEAQNATINQMKMFFTRMGQNSKFFITGDVTQIDLPNKRLSGLVHTTKILRDIKGITIVEFANQDIVRHRLVRHIVEAYENDERLSDEKKMVIKKTATDENAPAPEAE